MKPPDPLQMEPRTALEYHHLNVPHTGSLTNCPASPFATTAEQVEVLALADIAHATLHHHLEFTGWEGQGKGYVGPRRTHRATYLWIMLPTHRSH